MTYLKQIMCGIVLTAMTSVATAQEATTEAPTEESEAAVVEAEAETETTAPEEGAAETTEATEADQAFPVAEEGAEADVEIGKEYVKESFGAWQINCLKREEKDACNMYQLLRDETGNPTAEISILALPDGSQAQAGITLITPLGTLLTKQASFRIDAGRVARYPYSWCERNGCFARFGLTAQEVNAYKRGAKATVSLTAVANPEKAIPLEMSLDGFTAAFNALRELR